LRTAVVTPLHKKGSSDIVGNFRPISNLSSIGKFFEKCVLHRLDQYEELVGENQHGFRKGHSTVSAMLEVQNHLAKAMDDGLFTCIYSVDMSAAFDLLRPDTFNELLKDNLDPGLLWTLQDFLADRKFIVRYEGCDSAVRTLDRGCVQGSVLGPALFSAYCRNLDTALLGSKVTSYADDSYVISTARTSEELMDKLTVTMSQHFKFLASLGMVVNKAKTEVMFMKNKKHIPPSQIQVDGETIQVQTNIKVLGIHFDNDMSWKTHISNVSNRAQKMIRGLKVIRRTLNQEDIMKVITSQYYGSIYYALAVWFPTLIVKFKQKLDILHYKVLRVAIRDWMRLFPREMLDLLGRQKPEAVANYMVGSMLINCYNTKKPVRLYRMIKENEYTIRRTGKVRFYDSSVKIIGRQSISNRLDGIVQQFDDRWQNLVTKDSIRVYLKKTFFL